VGVNLITRSNFGVVTNQMARQSTLAQARVNALTSSTNRMATVARAGVQVFNTLGLAAAAATAIGIKGAADLQDAMAQTAVAMGKSTDEIDRRFTKLALRMSDATAQSVTNSMELLRTLATSGINDPNQMRQLAMPIALYADTQYLGKNHVAFNDSAALAAKISHQFGARTADQLKPILNTLFKISQDMPDSLQTAATQLGYYAATYTAAGVSATEVLQLQATLDRMGYGSRQSGRGMQMALRYLQNPTKKMGIAQDELGIGGTAFLDHRTGTFNVEGMIAKLHSDYAHAVATGTVGGPGGFNATIARAFPANAVQIISALASNAGVSQRQNVRSTMLRVPDLEVAQAQLLNTLNNQTKRLTTNFQSLATILEKPFIGQMTSAVGKLADALGNVTDWFSNHPRDAALAGGAMAAWGAWSVGGLLQSNLGHFFVRAFQRAGPGGFSAGAYGLGGAEAAGAGVAATAAGGGVLAFVRGILTLSSTRALPALIDDVGYLGIKSVGSKAGLELMGGALARLGLKIIPVVGEISLLVDAINLFHDHARDAGYAIGSAARWITNVGAPSIGKAFKDAFRAAASAGISGIAAGIWDFINAHNPFIAAGQGGIDFLTAMRDGFRGLDTSHVGGAPLGLNLAPRRAGSGLPGLNLPPPHRGGPWREQTRRVVTNHFHYHAAAGQDDATARRHAMQAHRKMAEHVSKVVASAGRTLSRAAGSTIASATMSSWETEGSLA
jgi:TP901 family phage tail tape measure protein